MTVINSSSEKETAAAAYEFASKLKGGEVIAFTGGMGMGKTAFVRGAAEYFGKSSDVSSPTFAIVNDYGGSPHLYHFDMYRVESWDSLYSTGFFDYMNDNSVLFIEWSENIDGALPDDAIYIHIEKGEGENDRKITIDGGGY